MPLQRSDDENGEDVYKRQGQTSALGDEFRRQAVCAAQKQLRVAISKYFLPKIERVSVLETRKVLKDAAHGYVSGSNHTETAGEVRNGPAGSELFPQDMDGNRQLAALTVLVRIPHQLDEAEGQEQACQKIKGAVPVSYTHLMVEAIDSLL